MNNTPINANESILMLLIVIFTSLKASVLIHYALCTTKMKLFKLLKKQIFKVQSTQPWPDSSSHAPH